MEQTTNPMEPHIDWTLQPYPWNEIGPAFRLACEQIVNQPIEDDAEKGRSE